MDWLYGNKFMRLLLSKCQYNGDKKEKKKEKTFVAVGFFSNVGQNA